MSWRPDLFVHLLLLFGDGRLDALDLGHAVGQNARRQFAQVPARLRGGRVGPQSGQRVLLVLFVVSQRVKVVA